MDVPESYLELCPTKAQPPEQFRNVATVLNSSLKAQVAGG